ncbi:MAG: PQQ-binding-like beta-propeller repeat protein [Natronomonas sp.]
MPAERGDLRGACDRVGRRRVLQGIGGIGIGAIALSGVSVGVQGQGEVQWRFNADGPVRSSATVIGDSVFIAGAETVYKLQLSGDELWRYELDTAGVIGESLTATTEAVFFADTSGNVYRLNEQSGAEEWRFDAGIRVRTTPTLAEGFVVFGCDVPDPEDATANAGRVYAVGADDGEEVWRFDFDRDDPVVGSPVVAGDTAFIGSPDDFLYALNLVTGSERWRFETGTSVGSGIETAPTVADGTVFVGSRDNRVYAVNADTGEERWHVRTNGIVRTTPTVFDGTVFVGSDDETLYAISTVTGDERWTFDAGDPIRSSPTVADGTVFFGAEDGTVHAVASASGDERWQFDTGGEINSSPTVVDGTLFVGTDNFEFYALDAGVSGSSVDSRIEHRTLGGHDRQIGATDEEATAEEGNDGDNGEGEEMADGDGDETATTDGEDEPTEPDEDQDGMGALAAIVGVGSAYLLKRRSNRGNT